MHAANQAHPANSQDHSARVNSHETDAAPPPQPVPNVRQVPVIAPLHFAAADKQPAGGVKRALDGRDGPGRKDKAIAKRSRAGSSADKRMGDSDASVDNAPKEEKDAQKKLVRMRRETNLRSQAGRISPRHDAPGSPRAEATAAPADPVETAEGMQHADQPRWQPVSKMPATASGKPTRITLSPRRNSIVVQSASSLPALKLEAGGASLPALPDVFVDPIFNDGFRFAPCETDENDKIVALPPAPATLDGTAAEAPMATAMPPDPAPPTAVSTSDAKPDAVASSTPLTSLRQTIAMLENVVDDWDDASS